MLLTLKACFQHAMACGDFRDLPWRRAVNEALRNKAFNILKNSKHVGCQRGLPSMVYRFFDKNTASVSGVKIEKMSNQELVEKLNKPIIREFEKPEVHSSFIDNICGAGLADMQLLRKFDKGICFLLCLIDIHSKYAWVVPLKDKKGITITNVFRKILGKSGRKPNKIWVDKGSEFYNRLRKSWLEGNGI